MHFHYKQPLSPDAGNNNAFLKESVGHLESNIEYIMFYGICKKEVKNIMSPSLSMCFSRCHFHKFQIESFQKTSIPPQQRKYPLHPLHVLIHLLLETNFCTLSLQMAQISSVGEYRSFLEQPLRWQCTLFCFILCIAT